MTTYLFSGFLESEFGTTINPGNAFTVPVGGPTRRIRVEDNDVELDGDTAKGGTSDDTTQHGYVYNGNTLENSGAMYVDAINIVEDANGNQYILYEIEIEGIVDDYYAFEYPPPPPGTALTVVSQNDATATDVPYSGIAGDDSYTSSGTASEDISAGAGNDHVSTGSGNDTISGGTGNDFLDGGAGNDSLDGGTGSDTIHGGIGNDGIAGRGGNDSLYGGAGSDTIWGGDGADQVFGGSENDTLYGGAGDDTLYGETGDDRIEGGIGNDSIKGGAGNDRLLGDAGNDKVYGGDGNDALFGNAGDDTLSGDSGQDTLSGGSGLNKLTGGQGDDFFHVGEGHDTVTDFGFGNTGVVSDGNSSNNDFLNLGAYYDSLDELRADQADDGILNQSNALDDEGKAVDYTNNARFGTTSSMTVQNANASTYSYDNTGIVCFAAGTRVTTPQGEVAIENLRPGDLVETLDHGPQPLLWVGRRHVTEAELTASEELRPILISKGALGNSRDLLVSRQHGMLIGTNHLVRAIHLAREMPGVRIANGKREVTYVHLFFARHEIVVAEGIASESFYPGPTALRMLSPAGRLEFLNLIPGLDTPGALTDIKVTEAVYGKTARPFVKPGDPKADQLIPPTHEVGALPPSFVLDGQLRREVRAPARWW